MWFCFFSFLFFLQPIISNSASIHDAEYNSAASTIITASIGENRVTINGYTTPNSRVELTSPKVFAVSYSDSNGYFIFDKTLLPKNPSDLCLASIDNNFRQTTPVCIPAPPATNYHTDIGPILLPPTLSLENDKINPNSTIITSGQAIPNSQVSLNFYKVTDTAKAFGVKEALAYSLPSVTAATDSQGNFSLNIPTAYSSNYRFYATAKFNDNYSPKSNTLIYVLPSLFYLFLEKYPFIKYLIPLIFLIPIILFYLLHLKKSQKSKILTPVPRLLPAIRHVSLTTTFCKIKTNNS